MSIRWFLPDQKYEKYNGPSLIKLFDFIDKHAQIPARDRLQTLNWVIFNFLIGNTDAHAKNLAMLVTRGKKMNLAPFYDILSTAIYSSLSDNMAMKIGDEDCPRWVNHQNWQQFAKDIGLNFTLMKKQAFLLADKMRNNLEVSAQRLNIPITHRVVKNIKKVISDRAHKLEASL